MTYRLITGSLHRMNPVTYTGFTAVQQENRSIRGDAQTAMNRADQVLGPIIRRILRTELVDRAADFSWLHHKEYIEKFIAELDALTEGLSRG